MAAMSLLAPGCSLIGDHVAELADLPPEISWVGFLFDSTGRSVSTGLVQRTHDRFELYVDDAPEGSVTMVGVDAETLRRNGAPDERTLRDTPLARAGAGDPLLPVAWTAAGRFEGGRLELTRADVAVDVTASWLTGCATCSEPKPLCDPSAVEPRTLPTLELNLEAVVLLEDGRALIAGRNAMSDALFFESPSGAVETVEVRGAAGPIWDLALESPDVVLGTSFGGSLFRLEAATGRLLARGRVPLSGPRLAVGTDGTQLVYGGGSVREIVSGSTRTMARDDFPPGLAALAVARRDRMAAIAGGALRIWDGNGWSIAYEGPEVDGAELTIDERIVAAYKKESLVLQEDPGSSARPIREPFPGFLTQGALAIGGGQLLIGGTSGGAAIRLGDEEWCRLSTGLDRPIARFAADAARGSFIATTRARPSSEPTGAQLARFTLDRR